MSTTTTSTHVGTVADLYSAFGRGDVPFILDHLSDGITWDHGLRSTDLAWFQPRTGKHEVEAFFGVLVESVTLTTFDPQMVVGDGSTVIAVIRIEGTINATGKPIEEDLWVHLWNFADDGKVASFRHIGDLARQEIPAKA